MGPLDVAVIVIVLIFVHSSIILVSAVMAWFGYWRFFKFVFLEKALEPIVFIDVGITSVSILIDVNACSPTDWIFVNVNDVIPVHPLNAFDLIVVTFVFANVII